LQEIKGVELFKAMREVAIGSIPAATCSYEVRAHVGLDETILGLRAGHEK
jgi:hypothetical protein